jgi:two-component system chemotaxis response regulator CheY
VAEILICDDEEGITSVLADWLDLQGHQTTVLNDSQLIKSTLLTRPFDLLSVDHSMPKITGKDVLEEIRKIFSPAELPVAFLTGHSEKDLVLEVAKSGIAGFFVKPLNFDSIEAKLPAMLPKRLNIKDVRNLMEKCLVPDRSLSSQPGLMAYIGQSISLFSVTENEGKYILASSETIKSLRQHHKLTDVEICTNIKVYTQTSGKWCRIFPTMWQNR